MDPPQAQTPVHIKSSMRSNRGSGGGFGGELDLQTEVVTVSHRTICANDMFQSVSLLCAGFLFFSILIFAQRHVAYINPFIF